MLAIVTVMQTGRGEEVTLLGAGKTEADARVQAQSYVLSGRGGNLFDEEYAGGRLVTFSPALARLAASADRDGWADTVNESGGLVESSATDSHHAYMRALGALYVVDGELRTRA